jgi:hypothetical protein
MLYQLTQLSMAACEHYGTRNRGERDECEYITFAEWWSSHSIERVMSQAGFDLPWSWYIDPAPLRRTDHTVRTCCGVRDAEPHEFTCPSAYAARRARRARRAESAASATRPWRAAGRQRYWQR